MALTDVYQEELTGADLSTGSVTLTNIRAIEVKNTGSGDVTLTFSNGSRTLASGDTWAFTATPGRTLLSIKIDVGSSSASYSYV